MLSLINETSFNENENKYNAYVNSIDNDRYNKLLYEVCSNKNTPLNTIKLLLPLVNNINYINPNYEQLIDGENASILAVACENERFDIVELLLNNNVNPNCYDGNVSIRANPNCYECNALINACLFNNLPTLTYLVEHGTDINAKHMCSNRNAIYTYALIEACERNYFNICIYLVEHGANLNVTDEYGRTAIFYAVKNNNINIVRYLVEHGASLDIIDVFDKTILIYAFEYPHIFNYLINNGINLNILFNEGNTYLHKIVLSNLNYYVKIQCIHHLYYRIDINIKNNQNITASQLAWINGNVLISMYLNILY